MKRSLTSQVRERNIKFTVVIAAYLAAALTLSSAAAQASDPASEAAPQAPAMEQAPAAAQADPGSAAEQPAAQAGEIAAVPIEETSIPVRGTVVGVPVPGLTRELYIGLGSAHRVSAGDYFLAYNPAVRAVAVIRVVRVQDRMSTAEPLAQLASLRNGDNVKRITARSALSLARQIESLTAGAPPLSSSVLVDADLLAASRALEGKAAPGAPASAVPAPAVPTAGLPDMAGVTLAAETSDAGIRIIWRAQAQDPASIAGYAIYRSGNLKDAGSKLADLPAAATHFEDTTEMEKGTYIYRLAAIDTQGRESASFPSIEVNYSPAKKKMLIGKKGPQIKTKSLPPFINPAASIPAVAAQASAAAVVPVQAAAAPVQAVAAPAAPTPAPVPLPAPEAAPAPAAVPLPAAEAAAAPAAGAALPPAAPTPPLPAEVAAPLPAAALPPMPQAAAPPDSSPPLPAEQAQPSAATLPAPARFSARVEGTTVDMSWNPIPTKEKLAGYLVYRGAPGDDDGAPLNSKPVSKTSYRDRSAEMGESYYYWVVGQTVEGRLSEPSRKVKVDMPKSKGVVPFF